VPFGRRSTDVRSLEADVVVVGAGLAGIAAARSVERGGASVVLVEARDRVGGRLESVEIEDGKWVDVGGQWIGPTQDRVEALARSLGHETFPTHARGENVVELGGKLNRYTGTIPRLPPHVLADVGQAMFRLDRMASKVPLEEPWTAARAQQWDSQTAWSWMRRNMTTRNGRTMLELAVKAVWAAMPADVSLLHLLFYIHSAGKLDLLLDTEGGAQQDRFVGGAQNLAVKAAAELGGEVVLSSPVRRIEHAADGVTLRSDKVTVRARRAIVAIPPTLAGRLAYDPPLPGYRDQLTQRFPMGACIKCMAFYREPFWRADGLSGSAVSDPGPLSIIFDNSPPDGSPGIIVGFLEGHWARELGRVGEAERRAAALENLARIFGPRAASPERYLERNWTDEEWSRGCYVGYTPPGVLTAYGPAIRAPIGPIHWAGTETATVWNGYMDGAIQSGERAAQEALAAVAPATAPQPVEAAVQELRS
jgi:monoamine oxidase